MDDIDLKQFELSPDDYELIKVIGKGTFATVFSAKNTKTNSIVAIKRFNNPLEEDKERLYFMREVEIMAKMQHPCIHRLHGFYLPDKSTHLTPLIITDYMPQGDLFTMLLKEMKGKAPESWNATAKMKVALGIAVGMDKIHKSFGIHRDLKPANILLDNNFEPKISDFGLSKITDGQTAMSIIAGSPYWMAPELLKEDKYSNKVDVYAYGVLLYQLLTGLLPFGCSLSHSELILSILSGERPKIPESLDDFYATLIRRCWDQDPEKRPSFEEITSLLMNTHIFLPNTNVFELKAYQQRIVNEKNKDMSHFQAALSYIQVQFFDKATTELKKIKDQYTLSLMYHHALDIMEGKEGLNEKKSGMLLMRIAAENGDKDAQNYMNQCLRPRERESILVHPEKYHDKRKSYEIPAPPIIIPPIYSDSSPNTPIAPMVLMKNKRRATYDGGGNQKDTLLDTPTETSTEIYNQGIKLLSEQKFRDAAFKFKDAAGLGHSDAKYQCGLMLLNGNGVKKDPRMAAFYFKEAADTNHPKALIECARLLAQGNGVKQDINKAIWYCKQAIKYGNTEAEKEYNELINHV